MAAAGGGAAELATKEASLFKNVVKFYEEKQYKKGLKDADKILRSPKFCEHGETLAMKGLILSCMDRKDEGYEYARRGLRNNLRSHVCWHVFGLMHRSDRNYPEAIKSYLQALRIDKDNMNILRDLSLLQIQMRELPGFLETRRKMLDLKSNQRNNWIGFALAHHLRGDYEEASKVLQVYEDTATPTEESGPAEDYEKSEMLMYKNMVIQESGDMSKALAHLDEIAPNVVDGLALRQTRATLLLTLERFDESKAEFAQLLEANADNYEYHTGLQCAHCQVVEKPAQWSSAHTGSLVKLYDEMLAKNPKAYTAQRIVLNFVEGDEFASRLTSYVKRYLRRGIPSLFTDVKALYASEEKAAIIEAVFEKFLSSLRASSTFPDSSEWEAPTVVVWVLCFLTQHNSHLRLVEKALSYIEEAISHTPTIVELYLVKARAQKRGGDLQAASETANYARRLDLQDRYLNSKCSLYFLRADKPKEAEDCMLLFTKEEGDQTSNLYEMQCMWFELESGRCFLRRKEYGKALKKFQAIDKHFTDWIDDQFDFHTYCLRKMTMRAYVGLLRLEDNIHSHKYFEGAAQGMIQCYLRLFDNPVTEGSDNAQDEFSHLTEKERKKALTKKRKAEAKAKAKKDKEEADNKDKSQAQSKDKKDSDPDGEELMRVADPLAEACKYLTTLRSYCGNSIATHMAACEVFRRLDKPLVVLQALNRAKLVDERDPEYHLQLAKFCDLVNSRTWAESEHSVKQVVEPQLHDLVESAKKVEQGPWTKKRRQEAFAQ